jgi:hypothetical protein
MNGTGYFDSFGIPAKYFKGMAIKNKQMVEIASHKAICLNILNIMINCVL